MVLALRLRERKFATGGNAGTQPMPNPGAPASEGAAVPKAAATPQAAAAGASAAAASPAAAGSPGRLPNPQRKVMPPCVLCKKEKPGHVVFVCQCLGPCQKCVPAPDRLDLYPTCLNCGSKVTSLFKVFL